MLLVGSELNGSVLSAVPMMLVMVVERTLCFVVVVVVVARCRKNEVSKKG
jgi:hypothetical protein